MSRTKNHWAAHLAGPGERRARHAEQLAALLHKHPDGLTIPALAHLSGLSWHHVRAALMTHGRFVKVQGVCPNRWRLRA